MKKELILSFMIALGSIAMLPYEGNAQQYEKARVTADILNVRTEAKADASIISKISKGQEILVVENQNDWSRVKLDSGFEGYVSNSFLQISGNEKGFLNRKGVNLRAAMDTTSESLFILNTGDMVEVLNTNGDWSNIKFGTYEGYIYSEYITLESEKNTVNRGETREIDKLAETAKSKIGTPYRYGSTGPSSFDCSGFVAYTYKNALNVSLPRTSRSQSSTGNKVSKSELQTGDLVYFATAGPKNGVSHIGIYLEDGKFIHASSGVSKEVTINSLNEKYYANTYLGATRILE